MYTVNHTCTFHAHTDSEPAQTHAPTHPSSTTDGEVDRETINAEIPAFRVCTCMYICDVYICDMYVCDMYVCDRNRKTGLLSSPTTRLTPSAS